MADVKEKVKDTTSAQITLRRLAEEEQLIHKALQEVRIAIEKNNIELMEVHSKVNEIQRACSQEVSRDEDDKSLIANLPSCSNKDIDNPNVVNQTKIDLSIFPKIANGFEEEESDDSD